MEKTYTTITVEKETHKKLLKYASKNAKYKEAINDMIKKLLEESELLRTYSEYLTKTKNEENNGNV